MILTEKSFCCCCSRKHEKSTRWNFYNVFNNNKLRTRALQRVQNVEQCSRFSSLIARGGAILEEALAFFRQIGSLLPSTGVSDTVIMGFGYGSGGVGLLWKSVFDLKEAIQGLRRADLIGDGEGKKGAILHFFNASISLSASAMFIQNIATASTMGFFWRDHQWVIWRGCSFHYGHIWG